MSKERKGTLVLFTSRSSDTNSQIVGIGFIPPYSKTPKLAEGLWTPHWTKFDHRLIPDEFPTKLPEYYPTQERNWYQKASQKEWLDS